MDESFSSSDESLESSAVKCFRKRKHQIATGQWIGRETYLSLDGTVYKGHAARVRCSQDKQFRSTPSHIRVLSGYNSNLASKNNTTLDPSSLLYWKIPPPARNAYAEKGVHHLFPWQIECLQHQNQHAINGGNLIYTAPTSGGKTLVAEILMINCILNSNLGKNVHKRAMFIVPYVSIVIEKVRYFHEVFGIPLNLNVVGFYNNRGGTQLDGCDIAVCTFERANGLLNEALRQNKIHEVGIIVFDELHIMAESGRGYLLESMIIKLQIMMAGKSKSMNSKSLVDGSSSPSTPSPLSSSVASIQLVGMSATLPNIAEVAAWMKAELYVSSSRPVPLHMHVIAGGIDYVLKDSQVEGEKILVPVRVLAHVPDLSLQTAANSTNKGSKKQPSAPSLPQNELPVFADLVQMRTSPPFLPFENAAVQFPSGGDVCALLVLESIAKSHSVLVFCSTRKETANTAMRLATKLRQHPSIPSLSEDAASARASLIHKLKMVPCGADEALLKTVPEGIAFHNAGLTMEERDLLESAFRAGTILCLVATTTVAVGVNLPAKRVILRYVESMSTVGSRPSSSSSFSSGAGGDGVGVPSEDGFEVDSAAAAPMTQPLVPPGFLDITRYRQMCGRAGRTGQGDFGESFLILEGDPKFKPFETERGIVPGLCKESHLLHEEDVLRIYKGTPINLSGQPPRNPPKTVLVFPSLLAPIALRSLPPEALAMEQIRHKVPKLFRGDEVLNPSDDLPPTFKIFDRHAPPCMFLAKLSLHLMTGSLHHLKSSLGDLASILRQDSSSSHLSSEISDPNKLSKLSPNKIFIPSVFPVEKQPLRRIILELICSGVIKHCSEDIITDIMNATLLATQVLKQQAAAEGIERINRWIQEVIAFLVKFEFVQYTNGRSENGLKQQVLSPLNFGIAAFVSGLAPEDALYLREQFSWVRTSGINLADDSHLLYFLIQPSSASDSSLFSYSSFLSLYQTMSEERLGLALQLGITKQWVLHLKEVSQYWTSSNSTISALSKSQKAPTSMNQSMIVSSGILQDKSKPSHIEKTMDLTIRQFWIAMILAEILQERPLIRIEEEFQIQRGRIQVLQSNTVTFAGQAMVLLKEIQWKDLVLLYEPIVSRLDFGIKPGFEWMMLFSGMTPARAKMLIAAKYSSVEDIAKSSIDDLESTLQKLVSPFSLQNKDILGGQSVGKYSGSSENIRLFAQSLHQEANKFLGRRHGG
jgi:replicative superfamily II helicase